MLPNSHVSLPQIAASLKKQDLINVVSGNRLGHIIDIDAKKRRYLIKLIDANVTYRWLKKADVKKGIPYSIKLHIHTHTNIQVSVAYFHQIGSVHDRKSNRIISEGLDNRKHHQAHIVLPSDSDTDATRNSHYDPIYYYQSADTFYLKLLSDYLYLLANIKANSKESLHRSNLLAEEYAIETAENLKRIIKYSDGHKMHSFMNQTQMNYRTNRFIQMEFAEFLTFHDDFKRLEQNGNFTEHIRWEWNFDHYLRHQVYNGRFDVDLYIYWMRLMIKYYNECSDTELKQYNISMHNISEMTHNIQRNTLMIDIAAEDVLDELLFASDGKNSMVTNSNMIQRLATEKLIVLSCIRIFNYLYHWMIEQRITKDIHLFIEEQIIHSVWFRKSVTKSLAEHGIDPEPQLRFLS